MYITLIDLCRGGLGKTLGGLRACLSCAEYVREELHDYRLRGRDDVLGSGDVLEFVAVFDQCTYSDSRKAW